MAKNLNYNNAKKKFNSQKINGKKEEKPVKGGKLYAGAKKIANEVGNTVSTAIKSALDKATSKASATLNARINSWRDHGVPESQISDMLAEIEKLDGVSVTSSGRIKIDDSKDEAVIKHMKNLIPTWTELKRLNKEVDKSIVSIDAKNKAEREQARASAIMELEAKRLRNRATDDLFGMWYEDKDNRLRSAEVLGIGEEDMLDLLDDLTGPGGLASRLAKETASAAEVYEFYEKVDEIIRKNQESKK